MYEAWMKEALNEALRAYDAEEVPIGCVIVKNERIIARGFNQVEVLRDATAHAEMIAITSASEAVDNWRLLDTTLVVTVEPCIMCFGAALLSRVSRIIYGAPEPRFGACGSQISLHQQKGFQTPPEVIGGVMEEDCRALLQEFFKQRRNNHN
jgi:tRNA(adenine34) deaminase